MAKLDPFFERTSRLAFRRLKREIEPRGTLGEFALEPDPPHLERTHLVVMPRNVQRKSSSSSVPSKHYRLLRAAPRE
jgi:hypothetical protein